MVWRESILAHVQTEELDTSHVETETEGGSGDDSLPLVGSDATNFPQVKSVEHYILDGDVEVSMSVVDGTGTSR